MANLGGLSGIRSLVNYALARPLPEPHHLTDGVDSAQRFLSVIGRSMDTKVKVESWSKLWGLDGNALKEAGVGVRDRRYLLWCMEKFRQGMEPAKFAHELKPKKKIRGHGPAVQNGKRIRSRRKQ